MVTLKLQDKEFNVNQDGSITYDGKVLKRVKGAPPADCAEGTLK